MSCPQLHSLNISGCSALEHVNLACPGLETLSAAQLPRLEVLQEPFACPRLREANFAGCKNLAGASCCNAMRFRLHACKLLRCHTSRASHKSGVHVFHATKAM